jgi:hypothetical protein
MDLKMLNDMPPWEWPAGTGEVLHGVLMDDQTSESDRVLATELAGDYTVIDDRLADALLSSLESAARSDEARGKAAISLGPLLEQAYIEGFEEDDELPITAQTLHRISASLRRLYSDTGVPKEVRRRCLEASVRAPEDWHREAIQSAYAGNDKEWKLTAVFCMRFVRGFDDEILEALDSRDRDIRYEAVIAAGNWEIEEAWPYLVALVTSRKTEKPLLLAAIEAVAGIRPSEAAELLMPLTESGDEDIVETVYEALALAEGPWTEGEEDDYDDLDSDEDDHPENNRRLH